MPTTGGGFMTATRAHLRNIAFGYDFFISYRSLDGSNYAGSLHKALEQRGFDCFLDLQHYEAGHNLPVMQTRALKLSTKLLVVVSPRANVSPLTGTDWLLAEVAEFKHLAGERVGTTLVSLGTRDTLSRDQYPESKLLPEIPTPEGNNLCIFDEAIARNGEVSQHTIDRLTTDFKQRRKRRTRRWALSLAGMGVICAVAIGVQARYMAAAAERATHIAESWANMDRGRDALDAQRAAKARGWFDRSADQLTSLGIDPLPVLHARFAADLVDVPVAPIAEVESEVGHFIPSADGNWLLVVQDYQAPSGSPDLDQILERQAFAVFHVPTRRWTLTQKVGLDIGKEIYQGADVVAFEPPEHVVLRERSGDQESFVRVSLKDGVRTVAEAPKPPDSMAKGPQAPAAAGRATALVSPERLFVTDPRDGIDGEYGPRTPEIASADASDGRTQLVGTYEGRYLVVDGGTGLLRAYGRAEAPIYAAAYHPDGTKAWFCDGKRLFEVNTAGWPGVGEFGLSLETDKQGRGEREQLLALAIADDGSAIAAVTTRRLIVRGAADGVQKSWPLPRGTQELAALAINAKRSRIDLVLAHDGSLISVLYGSASSAVQVVARPGKPGRTVAWIDAEGAAAWLIDRGEGREASSPGKTAAVAHRVPLPDSHGAHMAAATTVRIDEPLRDDEVFHALARVGSELFIAVGDAESFSDRRDLLDERLLRISLGPSPKKFEARSLFASQRGRGGPDTTSLVSHVVGISPGSGPGGLLLRTDLSRTYKLDRKGDPEEMATALTSLQTGEGAFAYTMHIQELKGDATVQVERPGDETPFKYMLPWRYAEAPSIAAIAKGGRQFVLGNRQGDILTIDVTQRHARR